MLARLRKYIIGFYEDHKVLPSLRAISVNFTLGYLSEFSEKDIKELTPDISGIVQEFSSDVPIKSERNNFESEANCTCEIIEKYKTRISSRLDTKSLSDSERNEIIEKYRSISVFLKKLKDYK